MKAFVLGENGVSRRGFRPCFLNVASKSLPNFASAPSLLCACYSAACQTASRPHVDEAVVVIEKLRLTLTKFAGADGFASLLGRALVLASADVPSLQIVKIGSDGRLEGFEQIVTDKATGGAGGEAGVAIGQAARSNRSVRGSPMKVTSSPKRCTVISDQRSSPLPPPARLDGLGTWSSRGPERRRSSHGECDSLVPTASQASPPKWLPVATWGTLHTTKGHLESPGLQ